MKGRIKMFISLGNGSFSHEFTSLNYKQTNKQKEKEDDNQYQECEKLLQREKELSSLSFMAWTRINKLLLKSHERKCRVNITKKL